MAAGVLGGAARHAATASAAAAAQEDDAVAADFGRIALVAVLVVPLPGLKAALHVDLLPLGEVFRQRFGRLPPQHHAVPLGLLLALTGLVVPVLGGRHVERRNRCAARGKAQLRVAPEIADQDDFVDASHVVWANSTIVCAGTGETRARAV